MTPAEKLAKALHATPSTKASCWNCRLRELRKSLGLSQQQAAEALGISHITFHRIENGSETTLSTAMSIAEFFGKPITQIWSKP